MGAKAILNWKAACVTFTFLNVTEVQRTDNLVLVLKNCKRGMNTPL